MAKGKDRSSAIAAKRLRATPRRRKGPPPRKGGGPVSPSPAREFLYGRNPVLESLRAGRRRFYRLILAEGVSDTQPTVAEILNLASRRGLNPQYSPRRELDETVPDGSHQGVLLEASEYPYVSLAQVLDRARSRPQPLVLVLDLLQDPQNVGTLLRTAEAMDVDGVVIQERRAVSITPAVVKASAGAAEHLYVARVPNLNRAIETLKDAGLWVVGLEALPEAVDVFEADLNMPIALVVGSESKGLRPSVREKCDMLVKLPMLGRVSSLNAAVAGSVALYRVRRAQGMLRGK